MDVIELVHKSENTSAVIVKTKILGLKEELNKYKDMCETSRQSIGVERENKLKNEEAVIRLRQKVKAMENQSVEMSQKVQEATDKLMIVTKNTDDCERARRALDHRKNVDADRVASLEQMLKDTRTLLHESERKYEEVTRKLAMVEADEERADARTKLAEMKAKDLQDEMKGLTAKLKSFQLQLEEFDTREEKYEQTISHLNAQIKNAQLRNEKVDDQMLKLQSDIKYLQGELSRLKSTKETK